MGQPSVLISVINWNSAARTLAAVAMLQQQDYANKRILVVDNASYPDSREALRVALDDEIWFLASDVNLGYAGGHRLAVERAQAEGFDCFWLLNTDVILHPQTLRIFVETFHRTGDALYGTVPLAETPGFPLEAYPVAFHRKFFAAEFHEVLFSLKPELTFGELCPTLEPRRVSALAGSSMFIPMTIIQQHGFMDERFFMYSEEVDYCFRLRAAGVACILVPEAYLIHEKEGTSKNHPRLRAVINYYLLRNQLVRIKRYGTRLDLLRAVLKDVLLVASYPACQGRSGLYKFLFGARAIVHGVRGQLGKTFPPEKYLDD